MAVLVPNLSSGGYDPYSFGIAETYSYVPIANDQGRPIFAKASYITNFDDLHISLSAGNLDIGAVHLLDWKNGLYFSIADVGLTGLDAGKGAIRVLTQDLDSDIDDITIGDKKGNFASVNAATSALNVFVVNPVSSVSLTNQLTSTTVTILNPVSSFSITNSALNVTIVEPSATFFQFNNFGLNTHRGWTMDDSRVPMFAVRVKPNQNITARIAEYEIGNNNANQSTIGYVWCENPTLTGSYSWIDLNSQLQYAIFTDAYGSNTPNGISGGTTRHSGIIIGKNSSSETEINEIPLTGGTSPNVLAIAVQRLDSGTKLDVWFAVTLAV